MMAGVVVVEMEVSSTDPADMLNAVAATLQPGDVQLSHLLTPFETPGWWHICSDSLVVADLELAFQAKQTAVRINTWIFIFVTYSSVSLVMLIAMMIDPSLIFTGKNNLYADSPWASLVAGSIFISGVTVLILCLRPRLLKMHAVMRWGTEVVLGGFLVQNIYASTLFYHGDIPPTMNESTRSIGVMSVVPFCMAFLSSSRQLIICCISLNASVILTSPHSGYANNIWVLAGNILIISISYFAMRREREVFITNVELEIAQIAQRNIVREQLQTVVAQAKSEQEEAAALAYNKQKAYQKVVAATAHDLRTASSAIQSGCRVLTTLVGAADGLGHDAANSALTPAGSVVESMTAMAKFSSMFLEGMALSARLLDGSSVPIYMKKINIQEVVDDAIGCGKLACSSTGSVEHRSEIDPGVGKFVYSDLNCISRNLINLISNASKHTVEGSIVVKVSLQNVSQPGTVMAKHPVYIEVAVRDTGSGVADEHKSLIFEPFVSMDESTGLGLFVVQMQSEALGGSSGVRDNPETHGAEFWFRVPNVTTEQELQEYNSRVPQIMEPGDISVELRPGGIAVFEQRQSTIQVTEQTLDLAETGEKNSGSILLIDDNLSLLELHAAELSGVGYTVSTALGGQSGLACLKMKPYTLVLIDIKMPNINGDEVVAAFRHWERNNRTGEQQNIYALSAYTNEGVQKRCADVGMAGVVAKPIRIEIIVELINATIAAPPAAV